MYWLCNCSQDLERFARGEIPHKEVWTRWKGEGKLCPTNDMLREEVKNLLEFNTTSRSIKCWKRSCPLLLLLASFIGLTTPRLVSSCNSGCANYVCQRIHTLELYKPPASVQHCFFFIFLARKYKIVVRRPKSTASYPKFQD